MSTKRFHLGCVLSITTGVLLSAKGIGGVYEILNFMTGDRLSAHQLVRARETCKPELFKQFPSLSGIGESLENLRSKVSDSISKDQRKALFGAWLRMQADAHGEWFDVAPLPADTHEFRDPVDEFIEMVGKDRVTVVAR